MRLGVICEQRSKNHGCKYHRAPSSRRHSAALQVAVVCWASAPHREPQNGGVCAAIAEQEMFDAFENGSATHSSLLATKCVRVNVWHEHVCALKLSSSRPGKRGPSQFTWNKSPKQIAHAKQSVFESFVLCVVVCCCVLLCVVVCCLCVVCVLCVCCLCVVCVLFVCCLCVVCVLFVCCLCVVCVLFVCCLCCYLCCYLCCCCWLLLLCVVCYVLCVVFLWCADPYPLNFASIRHFQLRCSFAKRRSQQFVVVSTQSLRNNTSTL